MTIKLISKTAPVLDAFISGHSRYVDQFQTLKFKTDSEHEAQMIEDVWDMRLSPPIYSGRDFTFDGETFSGAYRLDKEPVASDGQWTFYLHTKKTVDNPKYIVPIEVIDLDYVPDEPKKKKWYQWK